MVLKNGEKVVIFLMKETGPTGSQIDKNTFGFLSSAYKNKNQIKNSLNCVKKISILEESRGVKLYNFGVEHDLLNKTQKSTYSKGNKLITHTTLELRLFPSQYTIYLVNIQATERDSYLWHKQPMKDSYPEYINILYRSTRQSELHRWKNILIQIANKYVKRCLSAFIIREIYIKA